MTITRVLFGVASALAVLVAYLSSSWHEWLFYAVTALVAGWFAGAADGL